MCLDGDAVFFREGEEGLGGLFRQQRQVDTFPAEGTPVGTAEDEQRLGEVDRPAVDGVQTVDDLVGVTVRIGAGHLEERLRDRQRGAQLMGGVGREPLLFGDVRLEPGEHRVEGVGEFPELVPAARQPDPVGERPVRGRTGGFGDPGQRGEHTAGEDPASQEAEDEKDRQYGGRRRGERVREELTVGILVEHPLVPVVGNVLQEEHPHRCEQQDMRRP